MAPDDFEALAHRLVRLVFPDARRTANPDAGADVLLPRTGTPGWVRAWQARRYSNAAIAWKKCETALDAAVDAYAIERYTFVFAHDLSHTAIKTFDQRLKARHHDVTVDYWDLSELLAQLDETREGRRVTRDFFGPSTEELDLRWREAVALGGVELGNADDILGRLRALGAWLERRDDAYEYKTHTWETEPAEWRTTAGTVMSYVEVDDSGGRRIDALLRDVDRDDVETPTVRIDFTPDEAGRHAMDALSRAETENSSARLTEGFTVTFENLPGLWADDEDVVQTPDELRLDPIRPPRDPRRFVLKAQTGEHPVILDLTFEPCDLDGWRTAWRGRLGGLQVTFAVRQPSAERGEGYLHFTYELHDGASAREEREAVAAVQALQRPGSITIADVRHPDANVRFSLSGQDRDEQLHALAHLLEAIATIEDFTGERFALPQTIGADEGNLIVWVAHLVRTRAFDGDLGDEYVMPADDRLMVGLNAGAAFVVQEEKGVKLFGRTVWIGVLEYAIGDYKVLTDEAPDGYVLLRPRETAELRVTGRLIPGKVADLAVPPGLLSTPVEVSRRRNGDGEQPEAPAG